MSEQIINSKQSLDAYKKHLDAQFEKHHYLRIALKNGKQRTLTQNASLNLFCKLLADELNDAGIDFRVFVRAGYDVPWTSELSKDYIWRPIQKTVTGHKSTTKPKSGEYSKIYDVLNLKMIEYGIFVPWPCKENIK